MTDAARLHLDSHRSGNRLRNVELHELKGSLRARYLYCPHLRHDSSKIRSPPLERWCAHYSKPSDPAGISGLTTIFARNLMAAIHWCQVGVPSGRNKRAWKVI